MSDSTITDWNEYTKMVEAAKSALDKTIGIPSPYNREPSIFNPAKAWEDFFVKSGGLSTTTATPSTPPYEASRYKGGVYPYNGMAPYEPAPPSPYSGGIGSAGSFGWEAGGPISSEPTTKAYSKNMLWEHLMNAQMHFNNSTNLNITLLINRMKSGDTFTLDLRILDSKGVTYLAMSEAFSYTGYAPDRPDERIYEDLENTMFSKILITGLNSLVSRVLNKEVQSL